MTKLIIAFLLDDFPKVSESFILNQITGIIDEGHEVIIYAKGADASNIVHKKYIDYELAGKIIYEPTQKRTRTGKFLQYLYWLAVIFFNRPNVFWKILFADIPKIEKKRILPCIISFLSNSNFNLVHAHFGPVGNKAILLKYLSLFQVPLICSFHGYDVDRKDIRSRKNFYNKLFHEADILTVNSKFTKRNLISLGCNPSKIEIVPESLSTDDFNLKHKVLEGIVQLISVGRLVEFKGFKYTILALNELIMRGYKNVKLTIIGDGSLRIELLNIAQTLGIESYVTFLGAKSQEELKLHLSHSDIFILLGITSIDGRQENQGLVIQEAQASGLPVVVTDFGGIPEGMVDGHTGYLVSEGDFKDAADKLELLVLNPDVRMEMGKKGKDFVKMNFDTKIISQKIGLIYKSLLS